MSITHKKSIRRVGGPDARGEDWVSIPNLSVDPNRILNKGRKKVYDTTEEEWLQLSLNCYRAMPQRVDLVGPRPYYTSALPEDVAVGGFVTTHRANV